MTSLPTDNLYKFLALSGVAIVLSTIYFSYDRRSELLARQDQLSAEARLLKVDARFYQNRIQEYKASILRSGSIAAAGLGERVEELQANVLEIERRVAKLEANGLIAARLGRELRMLYALTGFALIVGGALAAVGFRSWYVRLQRYQDAELRKEAAATLDASSETKHAASQRAIERAFRRLNRVAVRRAKMTARRAAS